MLPFFTTSMTKKFLLQSSGDIVIKILWNKKRKPIKGLWTSGCLDSPCTIKSNLSSRSHKGFKWEGQIGICQGWGVWNLNKGRMVQKYNIRQITFTHIHGTGSRPYLLGERSASVSSHWLSKPSIIWKTASQLNPHPKDPQSFREFDATTS